MNEIKVIKTQKDHEEALALVEVLISHDPDPESEEGEKLELLSTLIEDYESKIFPQNLPSPIDAIKFRMEQMSLKPNDMITYFGSKSRVSEILSGKRQLTVEMIRALESGLSIPAKVLIKKPDANENSPYAGWDMKLIKEMGKRRYFGDAQIKDSNISNLLNNYFSVTAFRQPVLGMLRQSSFRASPLTDKNALSVWSECILKKAEKITPPTKYKEGLVNLEFMRDLAKLSKEKNSPIIAQKYLAKNGITLVIEPHFSKTYLDGATFFIKKENPVIGLTLRYDRLDNFWFTLMHELAHIALHSNDDTHIFYDEIEGVKNSEINDKERAADQLAGEALIPSTKWEKSPAKRVPSVVAAKSLADDLGIHISIVAGAIMHKHNRYYTDLNKITNTEKVRDYFTDISWTKQYV